MEGMDLVKKRIDEMPILSDGEIEKRQQKADQLKLDYRREQCWKKLKRDIGGRYREVSLDSFKCSSDAQRQVVDRLRRVGQRISEFVTKGHQLFFWGSIGSGKDHLAISVLKFAAERGISARWKQGTELYDRIACARDNGETQTTIYRQLWEPEILCLSDPVFDRNFTDAKKDALAKIVRGRYDRRKSTWITMNCGDLKQAQALLWADVYDRLKDNAIMIECKWKSDREAYKE